MEIGYLMSQDVHIAPAEMSARECAAVMRNTDIGGMPVAEEGLLVGYVTDRDLATKVTAVDRDPAEIRVQDVMSRNPLTIYTDESIEDAAVKMRDHKVRRLVAVNRDDNVVGVVSLGDLVDDSIDPDLLRDVLRAISEPTPPDQPRR